MLILARMPHYLPPLLKQDGHRSLVLFSFWYALILKILIYTLYC